MALTPEEQANVFKAFEDFSTPGNRELLDSESSQIAKELEDAGFSKQVEAIMANRGERPDEIFSGGAVSDIFDTLNALQYGVVGIIKGKSFLEGVQTRESFSKQDDLGERGIPGAIMGVALDIAVDPLTYIAPISVVGKLPGASKLFSRIGKVWKGSRAGQMLSRAFVYGHGHDPIYLKTFERSQRAISLGNEKIIDLMDPLTKLNNADQAIIATARKAGKLGDLSSDFLIKARPAFSRLDSLSRELVDLGLLDQKTFDETVGSYLPRLYQRFEIPGLAPVSKAGKKVDISIEAVNRLKKRGDLPEEVREGLGEIMEVGYPLGKGLIQLTELVEKTRFFNDVARRWGSEIAVEGLKQLPKSRKLGQLSERFVPEIMFDHISEITRVRTTFEKIEGKVVGAFKFGKVVMNPATHARNIMSNFILNDFEGLSPLRLDIYARAGREVLKKGTFWKEAKEQGLGLGTMASAELQSLLTTPEAAQALGKTGESLRKLANRLSNLYQKEEEFAKMAQYIFQRTEQGLSPEQAWAVAERATFNYAQVTPFIRRLRESMFGFPFITFTAKATPQVLKTIARRPTKISNIGKIREGIENLADPEERKRERAVEPDYIRDGFFLKLPFKDKLGRSAYLDLTYILPMGDLITQQFLSPKVEGESSFQTLFRKTPFLNTVAELARNRDFFGNKIRKDSSIETYQAGADYMKYFAQFYGPPILTTTPFRVKNALDFEALGQEKPTEVQKRTSRTLFQEGLRNIGLKITPFNVERETSKREREIRERLRGVAEDVGIRRVFKRSFKPKKKGLEELFK